MAASDLMQRHSCRTVRRTRRTHCPPVNRRRSYCSRPTLGPYLTVISHWLDDRGQPPKQRQTAGGIYVHPVSPSLPAEAESLRQRMAGNYRGSQGLALNVGGLQPLEEPTRASRSTHG